MWILACDGIQNSGAIASRAGDRSDLVKRRSECDEAVAGNPPIAWLEADHATERGGLADRTAGIAAESRERLASGNGGRRATARATRNA